MKQRIITGVFIALFGLPCLYFGSYLLKALIIFLAFFASKEITDVIHLEKPLLRYLILLAMLLMIFIPENYFFSVSSLVILGFCAIGLFYSELKVPELGIVLLMLMLFCLWGQSMLLFDTTNRWIIFYILLCAYGCDIGAYFTGVYFGKHKMCPTISPKKTWEGAVGGWIIGCLTSFIFALFLLKNISMGVIIVNSLLLPAISEIGDLTFSLIKRNYGVKDYGTLFPGHGGVFDRIDSIIFCCICFSAILNLVV